MVAGRKGGGWSGLRVFINHKITSWGPLFILTRLGSKWEEKLFENNTTTRLLQEVV